MRYTILLCLLAAAAAGYGCHKSVPAATPNVFSQPFEPTHAQPKLRTMKMFIGPETIEAELALTSEEIQTGMMFRTNIQDSDAMLFNLQIPQRADFWMKNCPESISVAYITPDGVIREIHHLEKNDTNGVVAGRDDIVFALETSDGWFGRHHIDVGAPIQSEKGPLAQVFLKQ